MGGISDCDIPDLSLRLGGSSSSSSGGDDSNCVKASREKRWSHENKDKYLQSSQQQQQQQQQQQRRRQQAENTITIFYNGQICVCDVTEIQAQAIISMARREMEEKEESTNSENNCDQVQQFQQQFQQRSQLQRKKILAPNLQHPQLQNLGLPMKRSLQRFLQKRKIRINAISPYNHRS